MKRILVLMSLMTLLGVVSACEVNPGQTSVVTTTATLAVGESMPLQWVDFEGSLDGVDYVVSDATIVSVSPTGVVTALSPGTRPSGSPTSGCGRRSNCLGTVSD
jgi:hypothetical protein